MGYVRDRVKLLGGGGAAAAFRSYRIASGWNAFADRVEDKKVVAGHECSVYVPIVGCRMLLLRLLVICCLVSGCGAQFAQMHGITIVDPSRQTEVAAATAVDTNRDVGVIEISGPVVFHDRDLLGNYYLVRSWVAPAKPEADDRFQIVAVGKFPKRVFLDQAYSGGRKLPTTVIDRERKCHAECYVQEVIGLDLDELDMVRYAASGIDFEISGRRASVRMSIPGPYFAAVLERHRSIRAEPGRRPPKSAASVPPGLSKTIAVGRL